MMRSMRSDLFHSARALALVALCASPAVAPAADPPRVVEITARRFEFAPNEVALRRGETVRLRLRSADVTHGLFVRALGIDTDVPPGRTTELVVTPEQAGRFTAICHHFCGSGHGNMKLTFVVE
jgi:cytochrome c oxidase subunit 2